MHDRREFALAALALAGLPAVGAEKPLNDGDALMDLILARFGKHLDEKTRAAVRSRLDGATSSAALVRRMKLDWQDEPSPYSPGGE